MRLSLALLLAVPMLFGQDDPPSRVARLNYIDGSLSLRPAGLDEWVQAEVNRPLTTGDNLWSEESTRAELHIGSTALRLGSRTAFEFLNLDDRTVQIRLAEGSLHIRLRSLEEDQTFEIDTPNLAFTLLRPGEYRIDVNPDSNVTIATVRSGDAEATGGGQSVTVHARQQARAGGVDSLSYSLADAPARDSWDQWCAGRDQSDERSESARYVSPEVEGAADLDLYGAWSEQPDYGAVWSPRNVPADWSPYHYGHWVWIEPWGWTWVDNAPWGFAPFHYGRWIFVAGGWGWVPGPRTVRPVYSPALVAWVGGPRIGAPSGGRPGVAWFPLGPGEVYLPAHKASRGYLTRVNPNMPVVNVTNGRYVNRTAPGGVTSVSEEVFVRSRPVAPGSARISGAQAASAEITTHAPYAPLRESLAGTSGARSRPPAAVADRQVVARRTPPPSPVAFGDRQKALQSEPGRPLAQEEMRRLRSPSGDASPRVRMSQAPAPVVAPVRQAEEVRPPERREAARPPEAPVMIQPRPRPVEVTPRRSEEAPVMRQVESPRRVEVAPVPAARPPEAPIMIQPRQRPVESAPQRIETPPARPVEPAPRRVEPAPTPRQQEPHSQRTERPVERQLERPPDRPVERHVERPPDRPVERHVERPPDRPVERPQRQERPAPEKKEDKPKQ